MIQALINDCNLSSLHQHIDQLTDRIPIVKNIHQIRQDQEHKICENLHKYNLMNEIGKVNPTLKRELQLIRTDQLAIKFAQLKQEQDHDFGIYDYDSYVNYLDLN